MRRPQPNRSRAGASAFCRASALSIALALIGCDESEIEEHRVAKGVERIRATHDSPPPAQGAQPAPTNDADTPIRVPDGWTLDPTPRQMRIATYLAPDPSGPIEVALTRFPGTVGGDLANINRGRGQMGLPPVTEAELDSTIERFSSPGFDGYHARIESDRGVMLAAAVYEAAIDQTWFLRATLRDSETADRLQDDLFSTARSIAEREGGG